MGERLRAEHRERAHRDRVVRGVRQLRVRRLGAVRKRRRVVERRRPAVRARERRRRRAQRGRRRPPQRHRDVDLEAAELVVAAARRCRRRAKRRRPPARRREPARAPQRARRLERARVRPLPHGRQPHRPEGADLLRVLLRGGELGDGVANAHVGRVVAEVGGARRDRHPSGARVARARRVGRPRRERCRRRHRRRREVVERANFLHGFEAVASHRAERFDNLRPSGWPSCRTPRWRSTTSRSRPAIRSASCTSRTRITTRCNPAAETQLRPAHVEPPPTSCSCGCCREAVAHRIYRRYF